MRHLRILWAMSLALAFCPRAAAEGSEDTDYSLFWRRDSLQCSIISSPTNTEYKKVGHHGPAVENSQMALRIYFNDSGAIDVYSKSGSQMELRKYLWYPSEAQQAAEGAGCDEYFVGPTVGLGGVMLWDGEKVVKVEMTEGRVARAGRTADGCYAEVISYGVPYKDGKVDISLRIDVLSGSPFAKVTYRELNGRKVQFLTGINYHPGSDVRFGKGRITVWGTHPANVSQKPVAIGGGMIYDKSLFGKPEQTENMVRIISKPTSCASTMVVSTSVKEDSPQEKLESLCSSRR